MNDGNTALPVSPVNKEEAMNLSSLFQKAAQAIVDASNYPDQVRALQAEVDRLSRDLSSKTIHSEELEKTLHEVRAGRQEAQQRVHDLEADQARLSKSLEEANRKIEDQSEQIKHLNEMLSATRKERDDFGFHNLELEDQVKQWKEKAEKARIRMNDVMALFHQPEPEPETVKEPEYPTTETKASEPEPIEPPAQEAAMQPTEPPAVQEVQPPKEPDNRPWWEQSAVPSQF